MHAEVVFRSALHRKGQLATVAVCPPRRFSRSGGLSNMPRMQNSRRCRFRPERSSRSELYPGHVESERTAQSRGLAKEREFLRHKFGITGRELPYATRQCGLLMIHHAGG